MFSETKTSIEFGLTCSFSVGNSWIIKKTDNGKITPVKFEENSTLSYNSSLHTKDNSLCELINNSFLIRLGANSIFEFNELNEFSLLRGSMLLYSLGTSDIIIESEQSSLNVSGKFTAIIDHTSNGGFKFIPFEGRGTLKTENKNAQEVRGGRLVLVLGKPSKLGDAYDPDLMLLLRTCRLINSFPDPLDTFGRISLAVYSQELKLKGKYNALIGDAPSDTNLQVWAFGEDRDQETEKKSKSN